MGVFGKILLRLGLACIPDSRKLLAIALALITERIVTPLQQREQFCDIRPNGSFP